MQIHYSGDEFDGINSLLFKKRKLNINYNVIATGEKKPEGNWGDPIVAIDPNNNGNDVSNDWVSPQFDEFPNITFSYNFYALHVTNYTYRWRMSNDYKNIPKSWRLEGSIDQRNWTLLHSIEGSVDFEKVGASKTYECYDSGYFTSFRLTMTERSSLN